MATSIDPDEPPGLAFTPADARSVAVARRAGPGAHGCASTVRRVERADVSPFRPANGCPTAAEQPENPPMTDTLIPAIDETRAEIDRLSLRTQLFIDGEFRDALGGGRFVTENPATGRPIAEVAQGGPADVDAAVAAARRAADDGRWSRLSPGDRKRILVRWADLIEANGRELGIIETHRRRQADHRHRRPRHARDRGLHPLARRGDRQALRPGRALARGHDRDDHPRAGRRRRRGHPVELPGPDGGLEARPGARDRQHAS